MKDDLNEFLEFINEFGTEEECRRYLFALRWPEGFRCPKCGHLSAWQINPIKYKCKGTWCRKQTSLYEGTLFQGSRQPLVHWFRAIGYVILDANETSALELQKVACLGSYHTALNWWNELRKIMFDSEQYKRKGKITFREFLENAIDSKFQ